MLNSVKSCQIGSRQYDLLEHFKQDNTPRAICHHSVCVIYDLFKAGRSTSLLIMNINLPIISSVSHLKKDCLA